MHKKLASDLTSLAHSILQMKNKDDVLALKEKAHEVYEKLALLAYVEEYINTTPQAKETKEELIQKIEIAEEAKKNSVSVQPEISEEINDEKEEVIAEIENVNEVKIQEEEQELEEQVEVIESSVEIDEEPIVTDLVENKEEIKEEEIQEQPFDELENLLFGDDEPFDESSFIEDLKAPIEEDIAEVKEEEIKKPTLEDELKDTLPVDVMADLFQKVEPKKTVNDHLQTTIQIGLNDRIAFVKHLFDGNQTDFNRVVSQLNTFKTEREAKNFISKMVKPDYDWSTKEEYEIRFIEIIERRFA